MSIPRLTSDTSKKATQRCGARLRRCRSCGYKFRGKDNPDGSEYDLLACPVCETDRLCRRPGGDVNGRCYIHNKNAVSGLAHKSFKHGLRSKYMPAQILESFQEAQSDPDLADLRKDVDLLEALISDRLTTLNMGNAAMYTKQAQDALRKYRTSLAREDFPGAAAQLQALTTALNQAQRSAGAVQELMTMIEARRKVTDSMTKQMLDKKNVVTSEQIMAFVYALLHSVKKHINDVKILTAIATDFRDLMSRRDMSVVIDAEFVES